MHRIVIKNDSQCQSCCSWQPHGEELRFHYRILRLFWVRIDRRATLLLLGRNFERLRKVPTQLLLSFIISLRIKRDNDKLSKI